MIDCFDYDSLPERKRIVANLSANALFGQIRESARYKMDDWSPVLMAHLRRRIKTGEILGPLPDDIAWALLQEVA
jgi:hypothetical protein